jgi:3-dehydroquinate synthase
MSELQPVEVLLSERSYPIWIGSSCLDSMVSELIGRLPNWTHAVFVSDENVVNSIAKPIERLLQCRSIRTDLAVVPSGEGSKCVAELHSLWQQLIDFKADRKTVLIAVGGGVVGDLAGFAAATYTRGVRFVQVPTTLLAMVDSSVGGKTGINLPESKNMIGAFWQPHAVMIDTNFLNTLPDREYRSGLAEVIKYGIILDDAFFSYLEKDAELIRDRNMTTLEAVIRRSCELKAHVVTHDERETTGLRAILNYGHTFGHAIEATTSYGQLLHGEAISIGMTMAGELACRLGMWDEMSFERQTALLAKMGLPTTYLVQNMKDFLSAMFLDKKTEHGKLNLILPSKIGHVQTVTGCELSQIEAAIAAVQPKR